MSERPNAAVSEEADHPPWTPFEETGQLINASSLPLPNGVIFVNSRYLVIRRECGVGSIGPLVWLSIKNLHNEARHDWRDFQRIKNELAGPETEAVELYPAESRLVDTSNQFHLWCLPAFRFPFGFHERLVSENTSGISLRPFALAIVNMEALGVMVTGCEQEADGLFSPGQIVITPGAIQALQQINAQASALLARHLRGEWGSLPPEDWLRNEQAVARGGCLHSVYPLEGDTTLWIITEADRSVTTVMLEEEY